MFTYQILKHPVLGQKVIRKDIAPWGFIFSVFWVLYKRIWVRGFIFLFVCILFPAWWEQAVGQGGSLLVPGIIALYTGFRGNYWYRQKLEKQGYEVVAETEAKSAMQALAIASTEKGAKNDG